MSEMKIDGSGSSRNQVFVIVAKIASNNIDIPTVFKETFR
jgi:hypothetical protein